MSADTQDIIDQILKDGVPDPEQMKAGARDAAVRQLEVAKNCQSTFGTRAGQAFLAHLRGVTLGQGAFVPGIGERQYTGLDAAHQGFLREGQNSIVREIDRLIALAERPPKELIELIEEV